MGALESLVSGAVVAGVDAGGTVEVVQVEWHGSQAVTLTYRAADGRPQERMLFRTDESTFDVVDGTVRNWSFDADGELFRLAAEARRIQLAHLFDPYVAISSSQVRPLPHQIEAVYGTMLSRQPLRMLLADDPGAGKTIMAGLLAKELMIRGDVERCLIVAPGSLVGQWQDELYEKFGLRFDVLTKDMLDAGAAADPFTERNLLIARVDQLARREDVVERLGEVDWDLVVVDEAHRMSAHHFSGEIQKTKKYHLGETLGANARHFLLMTATPHAGKEEDFQLFMALLDSDRFEGRFRDGVHTVDVGDLMLRRVKESLLTFDGTSLFPERRATTVKYDLSAQEMRLYDTVTAYVSEQMNRADRLREEGQGRRGNTVGFALTLLQRRLASSPEAIYQSLSRRRKRLEQRVIDERSKARAAALGITWEEERLSTLMGADAIDPERVDDALDDLDAEEREDVEIAVGDAATAAQTVAELEIEISILRDLEQTAFNLREEGDDAKWNELSALLQDTEEMFDEHGTRRKLIVFTEHRDTLNYLVDKLRTFLGSPDSVVHISGSTNRDERRAIQQRFTQDKDVSILVATDAAGEGVNLQRAHLLINYDLPWNPNRIEQRFGRVHRIGQTEVCHMWNLVAAETREAQVFETLLTKIDTQRGAYGGKIFDVIGAVLTGAELRSLLIDAIRYGDQPEVRDRIHQVLDHDVDARVRDKIENAPLAAETMAFADVRRIRQEMEEAASRRLQPHYIRGFFQKALSQIGGRMTEREPGRFQLPSIPPVIRDRDRVIGTGTPVGKSYERVVFDKDLVAVEGSPLADLIAPGHPLLDATVDVTLERLRNLLRQGAVLVDDRDPGTVPRVMVLLEHAIADDRPSNSDPYTVVSRRFEFVEIPQHGEPTVSGHAPYLDYRPIQPDEQRIADDVLNDDWLATDLEAVGRDFAIGHAVPAHLDRVRLHTDNRVDQTTSAVKERLNREINHWDHRANVLRERVAAGQSPKMNADQAARRAEDLQQRLDLRLRELARERNLRPLPPVVVGGALVLPGGLITPDDPEVDNGSTVGRDEVERRAIDAVLAAEAAAGWSAVDLNIEQPNHGGYDIRSEGPPIDGGFGEVRLIEVKGRIQGSTTVTVSRNEILAGLNDPDRFRLAIVEVRPDGNDQIRYIERPFENTTEDMLFDVAGVNFTWRSMWERGTDPTKMTT